MAARSSGAEFKRRYSRTGQAMRSGTNYVSMLFLTVFLFFCSTDGWTQDASTVEKRLSDLEGRLLQMEEEIQRLKERNARLEKELERRDELLAEREGAYTDMVQGVATERPEREHSTRLSQPVKDSPPQLDVAYKNGLVVSSQDDSFKLKLIGRVTSRFTAFESDHPSDDEFSVERARIATEVNLLEYYNLRIQVEFSEDPKLADGYLDINYVPWARLRLGQFKIPFSAEIQESHKYIDFAERLVGVDRTGLATRDIGVMLYGLVWDERMHYQLAVLNGSGANRGDDNDEKDLAARIVMLPFHTAENGIFSDLRIGAAATWGDQDRDFSRASLATIAGTEFVDFSPNTVHRGDRIRAGTELTWLFGPSSIKAEWIRVWLDDIERGGLKDDTYYYLWYLGATHLLTGEKKVSGRIAPNRPFNPSQGTWGAWELAARYAAYNGDEDVFELGMASGTDEVESFLIGLNWYLNEMFRITFNYWHSEFDDDLHIHGERFDDEDTFVVQCQLEF
jgi:phosphate-selective porin OprO/OprP